LLCRGLDRIAKLCANRGLFVGLITNGYALPAMAEEVATWGLGYLSMSTADRRIGSMPGPEILAMRSIRTVRYISHVISPGEMRAGQWAIGLAEAAGAQAVLHAPLPPAPDLSDADWIEIAALETAWRGNPRAVAHWPQRREGANPHRCGSAASMGVDGAGRVSWCRRVTGPGEGDPHYTDRPGVEEAQAERVRCIAAGEGACGTCWGNWRG
jgi:hypothetical protein